MVKRFHGSRRFIFTGSWSATHVLLSFVFFTKNRQFAAGNSPQYIAMFSCVVRIGSLAVSCPEVWARMYVFFTNIYIYTLKMHMVYYPNISLLDYFGTFSPKKFRVDLDHFHSCLVFLICLTLQSPLNLLKNSDISFPGVADHGIHVEGARWG